MTDYSGVWLALLKRERERMAQPPAMRTLWTYHGAWRGKKRDEQPPQETMDNDNAVQQSE